MGKHFKSVIHMIMNDHADDLYKLNLEIEKKSTHIEELKIKNNKLKKYLLIEVGISDEELMKLQEGIGVT